MDWVLAGLVGLDALGGGRRGPGSLVAGPDAAPSSGDGGSSGTGRPPGASVREAADLPLASRAFAVAAYMSTYSWPDRRMISYMISSVMERRTNRSFSIPA